MPDCPHIHIQDSGLQAFKDIIREETDGGRDIVRFLKGAANREYSNYQPHHELKAAEILAKYGFKEAAELVRRHKSSRPRKSASGGGSRVPLDSVPNQADAPNPDPAIDPGLNEFVQFIRDETDNGRTIVRNLIHAMETHEHPYKPHHNLEAAKQLIDNGFPLTDALICAPDCSHHSSDHTEHKPSMVEKVEDRRSDEERWAKIEADLKQMEEAGILTPDPDAPPIDISMYRMPKDFDSTPYEEEEFAAFKAEIELRVERQKQWPEIEERRRKKLAQIYPSHTDGEQPET